MIRTLEAILALVLVVGASSIMLAPTRLTGHDITPLREAGERLLVAATAQERFRALAAGAATAEDANALEAYLRPLLPYAFTVRVCPVGGSCFGNTPHARNVTVVTYYLDGNTTLRAPRKLKLYLWLRRGESAS